MGGLWAVMLAAGVGACGEARSPSGSFSDAQTTPADATQPPVDVSSLDAAFPVDHTPADTGNEPRYPAGPYGTREGDTLEPFSLTACNRTGAAAEWRFDQSDFFSSQLTVVMITTMGCLPCQQDAARVESQLVARFEGRGLRVVQVLVRDERQQPIAAPACEAWVAQFGLRVPVLMDPQFVTERFVTNAAFPSTLLVDREGRIRGRVTGSSQDLSGLQSAIDDLLDR